MSSINTDNPRPKQPPDPGPAKTQDTHHQTADSQAKHSSVDLRTDPIDPRFAAWIDSTRPEPEPETQGRRRTQAKRKD